jgi:hypothetical protein
MEGERLRVIVRVSGNLGSISIASLVLGRSDEVVIAAADDDDDMAADELVL